ncbi:MAG: tetratricopeptide repeat protein, partial [Nitrospiraceae bacterium]
ALTIREKALEAGDPELAVSLNNLAALYDSQGKYAEAEPLYQRAYTIMKARLGLNHPNTKTVLSNYAEFLVAHDQEKLPPLVSDLQTAFPELFAGDKAKQEGTTP